VKTCVHDPGTAEGGIIVLVEDIIQEFFYRGTGFFGEIFIDKYRFPQHLKVQGVVIVDLPYPFQDGLKGGKITDIYKRPGVDVPGNGFVSKINGNGFGAKGVE
jgi:hypothetical protein